MIGSVKVNSIGNVSQRVDFKEILLHNFRSTFIEVIEIFYKSVWKTSEDSFLSQAVRQQLKWKRTLPLTLRFPDNFLEFFTATFLQKTCEDFYGAQTGVVVKCSPLYKCYSVNFAKFKEQQQWRNLFLSDQTALKLQFYQQQSLSWMLYGDFLITQQLLFAVVCKPITYLEVMTACNVFHQNQGKVKRESSVFRKLSNIEYRAFCGNR